MNEIKDIENKKNEENRKHAKGLRKILAGILIVAGAALLIPIAPAIPIVVAVDNFVAGLIGGIISPVIIGGIGAFGIAKTVSGGIKAAKAKKNILALEKEENKGIENMASQIDELKKERDAIAKDRRADEVRYTEALTDIKKTLQPTQEDSTQVLSQKSPTQDLSNDDELEDDEQYTKAA